MFDKQERNGLNTQIRDLWQLTSWEHMLYTFATLQPVNSAISRWLVGNCYSPLSPRGAIFRSPHFLLGGRSHAVKDSHFH
jgi:hypothetical protein